MHWAQDEYFPKFSCVWYGLSSYLGHSWKNGFYLQVLLCKQVCLNPAASDLTFFHLCCFSEVIGNLHYFLFGHLASELIFSHLGRPLLQRAELPCEGSESTSSGCVVLGAAHTPWLVLLDQTAEHAGPACPWGCSQLLPNPAALCGDLQQFVSWWCPVSDCTFSSWFHIVLPTEWSIFISSWVCDNCSSGIWEGDASQAQTATQNAHVGIWVAQDLWSVRKQTFGSNMLSHSTMQAAGKGVINISRDVASRWLQTVLPSCAITSNVLWHSLIPDWKLLTYGAFLLD